MHFSILLAFSALLGISFAGETTKNDLGSASRRAMSADEIAATENNGYDKMTNRKLWRVLIKKGKALETGQLQLQHLLNLRQEKLNKLNGMPLSHKLSMPDTDIPAEIARGIQYILAFIAEFYETNIRQVDESESSRPHNRNYMRSNPYPYPPIGGSIYEPRMSRRTSSSNQPYQRYSQLGSASSSNNPGLKPQVQSGMYPTAGGSTHDMSHQQFEDASRVGAINDSFGDGLTPQLKSEVYPPVGKDTYEPRISSPNELYQGSSQIGTASSFHNHGIRTQVQAGVYPPAGGNSLDPRMSHQSSSSNQPYQVSSQVGSAGNSHNNGLRKQVQYGEYPPVGTMNRNRMNQYEDYRTPLVIY